MRIEQTVGAVRHHLPSKRMPHFCEKKFQYYFASDLCTLLGEMPIYKNVVIITVIGLSLLGGLRGFWDPHKDIFTLHPYFRPISTCTVTFISEGERIEFPSQSYRGLPTSYFRPAYMELQPIYLKGLQKALRSDFQKLTAHIECDPLYPHDFSDESYVYSVE